MPDRVCIDLATHLMKESGSIDDLILHDYRVNHIPLKDPYGNLNDSDLELRKRID